MTRTKADALATILGGKLVIGDTGDRSYSVGITRADGRYAHLQEDAGAVYFDEHACLIGYLTCGSDPRGVIDAEEWGEWNEGKQWAQALATVLGPGAECRHVGGNIYLVHYQRPDGRYAIVGAESGCVFPSREAHDDDPAAEQAAHFEFS